jgi:hypothetical protein
MAFAPTLYLHAAPRTTPYTPLSEEEQFKQNREAAEEWSVACKAHFDAHPIPESSFPEYKVCPRHPRLCTTCSQYLILCTCNPRTTEDPTAECNECPVFFEQVPPFRILSEFEYILSLHPNEPDFCPALPQLPICHSIWNPYCAQEIRCWKFMAECGEGQNLVVNCDGNDESMSVLYYTRKSDFFVRQQFEISLTSARELEEVPVFYKMEPFWQEKLNALVAQFELGKEQRRVRREEAWKKWSK